MYEIQHINKEENVLISGTREESAVRQFFSGSAHFSCCANISVNANMSPGAKFLASA
jgi:hypothetical protein